MCGIELDLIRRFEGIVFEEWKDEFGFDIDCKVGMRKVFRSYVGFIYIVWCMGMRSCLQRYQVCCYFLITL